MTLTGFIDYSELFAGCICYLDLSAKGISGTEIYNLFGASATKNASSALTSTDRFGFANNALKFNGTLDGGINTGIYAPSVFTIITWISPYMASGATTNSQVFGDNNNANSYCRGIRFDIRPSNSGSPQTQVIYGPASGHYSIYNAISDFAINNEWTMYTVFVSGSASGSLIQVYKNLIQVLSRTTSDARTLNHNYLRIGSQGDTYTGRQSTHVFGEFLLFNRVLSIAEMAQIYRLTSIKYLPPVQSGIRGCE